MVKVAHTPKVTHRENASLLLCIRLGVGRDHQATKFAVRGPCELYVGSRVSLADSFRMHCHRFECLHPRLKKHHPRCTTVIYDIYSDRERKQTPCCTCMFARGITHTPLVVVKMIVFFLSSPFLSRDGCMPVQNFGYEKENYMLIPIK